MWKILVKTNKNEWRAEKLCGTLNENQQTKQPT